MTATITTATDAAARIQEIRANGGETTTQELDKLWAKLDTLRVDELIGAWKGSEFITGHPTEGELQKVGWYGKIYNSATDAVPLASYDDDRNLYSNVSLANGGEASLWMVEYRGEVTATMVYDAVPTFDHLKRIDETTLLGIMNGKEVPLDEPHYYFVLEFDETRPVPVHLPKK